jgi:hypothetical protein
MKKNIYLKLGLLKGTQRILSSKQGAKWTLVAKFMAKILPHIRKLPQLS